MNRNMAIRRLWWKELRQLVPLIGLLLLVSLLLMLFSLVIRPGTQQRDFVLVVLLGMPSLFAAGAGSLLVGQEKEVRSIDWLRSLPVPSVDVVRTKLLAAILALATIWLLSLGLALVVRIWGSSLDQDWVMWVWPLYSLYLLLVGFATAWQLRSSLVSLLLVVPLAGLPLLLANVHEWVASASSYNNRDPAAWLVAVYIALVGTAVLVWGWRAALAYMSPERSSVGASRQAASSVPTARSAAQRSTPAPSLLWQFYTQNRGILIGLIAVILISSLLIFRGLDLLSQPRMDVVGFVAHITIFLSVSWLGLLTFQSDTLQRRSQFLADRGVSPRLTWLTRQAFPWLLLVVTASCALIIARDFLGGVNVLWQVAVMAAVIAIYGASQWLGQTLRSMILSAIIAPLISLLFVGYLIYAFAELVAPSWLIALTLLIPLVATFGATAAWMDGRTGWRFWAWHGCMLALAVVLPSLNFMYLIVSYPQMSASSRAELTRAAAAPHPGMTNPASLGLEGGMHTQFHYETQGGDISIGLGDEPSSEEVLTLAESRTRSIAGLRTQMDVTPVGMVQWDILKKFAADVIIDRIDDPEASQDEQVTRYRESLSLIVDLTKRQRRALRLLDQDLADDYEMLLLEEMQAPLARQRMGDELHASIVALLSDTAGRDAARRTALAASWQKAQPRKFALFSADSPELGGYSLLPADLQQRVTPRDMWQASRKVGLVSEQLLQLLDATSDAQREAARTKIYALLSFKELPNISSGAYLQSADGPKLLYGELGGRAVPGRAWRGEWERRAASLRTETR